MIPLLLHFRILRSVWNNKFSIHFTQITSFLEMELVYTDEQSGMNKVPVEKNYYVPPQLYICLIFKLFLFPRARKSFCFGNSHVKLYIQRHHWLPLSPPLERHSLLMISERLGRKMDNTLCVQWIFSISFSKFMNPSKWGLVLPLNIY